MNIPESVIAAAEELVGLYGGNFVLIGKINGKEVYQFLLPEDEDTGFPILFLYDQITHKTEIVTGMNALKLTVN